MKLLNLFPGKFAPEWLKTSVLPLFLVIFAFPFGGVPLFGPGGQCHFNSTFSGTRWVLKKWLWI